MWSAAGPPSDVCVATFSATTFDWKQSEAVNSSTLPTRPRKPALESVADPITSFMGAPLAIQSRGRIESAFKPMVEIVNFQRSQAPDVLLILMALVAWAGSILVWHDAAQFSSIRAQIDRRLVQASYSEKHPSFAVRQAFDLESPHLIWRTSFSLYRAHWSSYPIEERPNFYSSRILVTPMWWLQVSFWYSRSEVETYVLHTGCYDDFFGLGGCDELSKRVFGKSLNEVNSSQLSCIRAFHRTAQTNSCPDVQSMISESRR